MKRHRLWACACCVLAALCSPVRAGAPEARAPVLVMLGDSTTDQGTYLQVKKQLDALIHLSAQRPAVINAGKGGDNATSALGRLGRDVLAHAPNIVTVSFGLNDTGGRDPKRFEESLRTIVRRLTASGAQVVLLTSTPFVNEQHGWGKQEVYRELGGLDEYMDREFCARVRSLADEEKVPLCDLHTIFKKAFAQHPGLRAQLISGDGVHLTGRGMQVAARHIVPVLMELLPEPKGLADGAPVGHVSDSMDPSAGVPEDDWRRIAIAEPGFEADGSWRFGATGKGVDGHFTYTHAQYADAGLIDRVPERGQFFTYNNSPAQDLYQVLSVPLAADTHYRLCVTAIAATFSDPFPGGELRLGYVPEDHDGTKVDGTANDFYGACLLKPAFVRNPAPLNGPESDDGYVNWTWIFTTGAAPAGQGRPLRVELLGGGKAQSLFDNVRLDASAVSPSGPGAGE